MMFEVSSKTALTNLLNDEEAEDVLLVAATPGIGESGQENRQLVKFMP